MQAQAIDEGRAEKAAADAHARVALRRLLDRLALDLRENRAPTAEVAAIVCTLSRHWPAQREPNGGLSFAALGDLVGLLEPGGPRLPLRELVERCERLRSSNSAGSD